MLLESLAGLYRLLLFILLGLTGGLLPDVPQSEIRDSGYGLYVFATASDPTVTNGSSSGGNPLFFWRDLEPEEGVYNWTPMDRAVLQAARTGTKIVPRIVTNFSIFGEAAPDWFFDAPNAQQYYPHEAAADQGFRAPVAWDAVYQEKFGTFVKALGERYNHNPTIEFIQTTSAGVYGELYLGSMRPEDYTVEKHKASIEYWTDAWRDAFPNTNLSIMINGLADDVGRDAADHAVSRSYFLQMNSPEGHPATRALLAEYDRSTKIVIEAENGGCSTATGPAFRKMVDELFSFGYHVDYVMFCAESFTAPSTAATLERAWGLLLR